MAECIRPLNESKKDYDKSFDGSVNTNFLMQRLKH